MMRMKIPLPPPRKEFLSDEEHRMAVAETLVAATARAELCTLLIGFALGLLCASGIWLAMFAVS